MTPDNPGDPNQPEKRPHRKTPPATPAVQAWLDGEEDKDKLLNPDYAHDKEYVVTTKNKLRASFREKMEKGVNIGEYTTKPCKVQVINDYTFRITLTEGKKHQIRRMCDALFQEVDELKRTKIMNINLGQMESGSYRQIEEKELTTFMESLGF